MKTATYIKLDKEVKTKAQELARNLGFPLSTVINAQLKQFIRDEQLVVSTKPQMSPYLEKLITKLEKDFKNKKNWSKVLKSKKDLSIFFQNL